MNFTKTVSHSMTDDSCSRGKHQLCSFSKDLEMHHPLTFKTFTNPLISFQNVWQGIKFYVWKKIKKFAKFWRKMLRRESLAKMPCSYEVPIKTIQLSKYGMELKIQKVFIHCIYTNFKHFKHEVHIFSKKELNKKLTCILNFIDSFWIVTLSINIKSRMILK